MPPGRAAIHPANPPKFLFGFGRLDSNARGGRFFFGWETRRLPAALRSARFAAAEQALADANGQQAALRHLPFGLHISASTVSNERLLFQTGWIALYDDDLRIPLRAAYELTK